MFLPSASLGKEKVEVGTYSDEIKNECP